MKKFICIALATIALCLANSFPGYAGPPAGGSVRGGGGVAWHGGGGWHGGGWHGGGWHGGGWHGHGHSSFGVFIGPGWWGYPYPYYYPYYPYYSYPYPYYYTPPTIPQQQYEYVEPEAPSYWYFCQNPKGYYPYVKQCPKGWLKVVPKPVPKGEPEEE